MAIPDGIRQWRKAQRAERLARRVATAEDERLRWNEAITGKENNHMRVRA